MNLSKKISILQRKLIVLRRKIYYSTHFFFSQYSGNNKKTVLEPVYKNANHGKIYWSIQILFLFLFLNSVDSVGFLTGKYSVIHNSAKLELLYQTVPK